MASGIEFKAIGRGLDDLARTIQSGAMKAPDAFAYANSGLIQLAGDVLRTRYIVPGHHSVTTKSGYTSYTAPPGATHGPIRKTRDGRGYTEKKIYVKGKFVDRTGGLLEGANDIAASAPSTHRNIVIADSETGQKGKNGKIIAGIDGDGNGYIRMTDGYRAAEVGSRGVKQEGKRGVWRSLRTVRSRWASLLKKKYPDLFQMGRA